jgi:hypothetical protein
LQRLREFIRIGECLFDECFPHNLLANFQAILELLVHNMPPEMNDEKPDDTPTAWYGQCFALRHSQESQ